MSGTVATYNGVILLNVETISWEESMHMDDSNTDLVYSLVKIKLRGVVHDGQVGLLGFSPDGANGSAPSQFELLLQALNQPRGDFTYSMGDITILDVSGTNLQAPRFDVCNGPKPKVLSINYVTGYRVIGVEWEVELALNINDIITHGDPTVVAAVLGKPAVLSNRWSARESRDKNFYSQLEYQGMLIVNSIKTNADLFRSVVVPPLLPGFQRQHVDFLSTPDGLQLKYRVLDQEIKAGPPKPATDWECTYTVETTNGALIYSTINVKLWGKKTTTQHDLVIAAIQVCEARLGNLSKPPVPISPTAEKPPYAILVKGATVMEDLKNNTVTMTVRVQQTAENIQATLKLTYDKIGQTLAEGANPIAGYDVNQWPVEDLYNTAVGAFAFQLASVGQNRIPTLAKPTVPQGPVTQYPPSANQPTPPETPPTIYNGQASLIDPSTNQVSPAQMSHQYTYVEIESRYEITTGTYQQPVALSSTGGSADSSSGSTGGIDWTLSSSKKDTASFCILHQPICRRIFKMRAERAYEYPQLPTMEQKSKDINGIDQYLLDVQIIPVNPELLPDQKNYLYRSEIQFIYGLSRPPTPKELYIAGSSPVDNTTGATTAMPASILKDQTIQGKGL